MIIDNSIELESITSDDLAFDVDLTVSSETLDAFIKKLAEVEKTVVETSKINEIKINAKKLPFERRIQLYRHAISGELLDATSIVNVLSMIKSYTTFDDSFFEDDQIWVNSLEEILDLKIALKEEFRCLIKQICIYYLSLQKSASKLDVTFLDNAVDLPLFFQRMMYQLSINDFSTLLNKTPAFSIDELVIIKDGFFYLADIIQRQQFGNSILQELMN